MFAACCHALHCSECWFGLCVLLCRVLLLLFFFVLLVLLVLELRVIHTVAVLAFSIFFSFFVLAARQFTRT